MLDMFMLMLPTGMVWARSTLAKTSALAWRRRVFGHRGGDGFDEAVGEIGVLFFEVGDRRIDVHPQEFFFGGGEVGRDAGEEKVEGPRRANRRRRERSRECLWRLPGRQTAACRRLRWAG